MLASNPDAAHSAAFDYMMATGYLFGGWHLARAAKVAQAHLDSGDNNEFYTRKVATAAFYAQSLLPRCEGHSGAIASATGVIQAYPVEWL